MNLLAVLLLSVPSSSATAPTITDCSGADLVAGLPSGTTCAAGGANNICTILSSTVVACHADANYAGGTTSADIQVVSKLQWPPLKSNYVIFGNDALGADFCCAVPGHPTSIIGIGADFDDTFAGIYCDRASPTPGMTLKFYGGDGMDSMVGSDHQPTLMYGEDDDDNILFGAGGGDAYGGDGFDEIIGGSSAESIYGGDQGDVIVGGGGNDTILGGTGDDRISGDGGADTIYGGYGHDTICGGDDGDTLYGEGGNDWLYGGSGTDTFDGGDLSDTCDNTGGESATSCDTYSSSPPSSPSCP
ncbi:MAG: hypothetical protein H6739_01440 [Alphaproteobacteria bacterium]|nr:hypothetical protein [Alphaproteobacteria bacterium]